MMKKKPQAVLAAHVDTTRVSEDVVRAVPAPEFTSTWRPYSHAHVLDAVGAAVAEREFNVNRREYSLNAARTRMFGVWELGALGSDESCLALGIRSATDKSMAIGLCAGERVFVCDNLAFSSSFVLFRKHTGRLAEEEIYLLAREALTVVVEREFPALRDWRQGLRTIALSVREASLLTTVALSQGIIPPSQFSVFYKLFLSVEARYDLTLYGFHGAVTELVKDRNLVTVHDRNDRLNAFLKYEATALLGIYGNGLPDFERIHADAMMRAAGDREVAKERGAGAIDDLKRKVRQELKARRLAH